MAQTWKKIVEADPEHSRRYAQRWDDMVAEGMDIDGEARLADAMAPRGARILDAGWLAHEAADGGGAPGSAEDILWALWSASGLAEEWAAQALAGGAVGGRADHDLDAVLVLFGAAESFVERLPGARPRSFLEHVRSEEIAADTLVVGARTEEAVEVLTPQAAAGRRWQRVAVVGVQDGVWPAPRRRSGLLGVDELVDLTEVAGDGPLRDQLLVHWYGNKVLDRLGRTTMVDYPDDYREHLLDALEQLVADMAAAS